jgi:hypothetical protein
MQTPAYQSPFRNRRRKRTPCSWRGSTTRIFFDLVKAWWMGIDAPPGYAKTTFTPSRSRQFADFRAVHALDHARELRPLEAKRFLVFMAAARKWNFYYSRPGRFATSKNSPELYLPLPAEVFGPLAQLSGDPGNEKPRGGGAYQDFLMPGSLLQAALRRHLAVNFVIVELLWQEDGTVTRFMKNYEALIPIRLPVGTRATPRSSLPKKGKSCCPDRFSDTA